VIFGLCGGLVCWSLGYRGGVGGGVGGGGGVVHIFWSFILIFLRPGFKGTPPRDFFVRLAVLRSVFPFKNTKQGVKISDSLAHGFSL